MLNLKKLERDALTQAQNTDAQALSGARQALSQLQGVESALTGFSGQYTDFLKSLTAALVASEVNNAVRADSRNAQPANVINVPQPTNPPGVQGLQIVASQVATGRASLAATIGQLEAAMSARAARIAQLADNNGGTQ